MNFYVLSWLLFFLAPGGCPIYSIDLSTLEVNTNDFQNELTLQSMLNSELREYRNDLNERMSGRPEDLKAVPAPEEKVERTKLESGQPDWLLALTKLPKLGSRSAKAMGSFLGTNLFDNHEKHCFSTEDIALMSARRDFELLVPKSFPHSQLTESVVNMLIKYFDTVNRIVAGMSDEETRRLLQRAFYDAMGGYLRFFLVPAAQISFYAGRLKMHTVERLVKLYSQCRIVLNTNGNGWKIPASDNVTQFKGNVEPVKHPKGSVDDASSCAQLDQKCLAKESDRGEMVVPLPRLEPMDDNGHLSNIYLPFRQKHTYNMRSPESASILVKFFQTLTSCHTFQGISQIVYNRKLLAWIRDSVQLHYTDEMFYPGLEGILQIEESIVKEMKTPVPEHGKKQKQDQDQDQECETPEPEPVERNSSSSSSSSSYEDSRKLSRSANHWKKEAPEPDQDQEEERELSEPEKIKERLDEEQESEECVDCDSNHNLIWGIAALLALLLLIILLIICCCMRRGSKKKTVPPDVEAPVFKEKSKKQEEIVIQPRHEFYYSGSSRATQVHKFVPDERYPENKEIDSFTSSSSMKCQFNRKCLPIKFSTRGEGSKDGKTQKIPTLEKINPAFVSTDSSPRSALRYTIKALTPTSLSVVDPTSESELKSKRIAKRVQPLFGPESKRTKRKEAPEGRRTRAAKTSEESEKPTQERRKANRGRVDPATDVSADHPRPNRKASKSETKGARLMGGSESVKGSPSWETTFEDYT